MRTISGLGVVPTCRTAVRSFLQRLLYYFLATCTTVLLHLPTLSRLLTSTHRNLAPWSRYVQFLPDISVELEETISVEKYYDTRVSGLCTFLPVMLGVPHMRDRISAEVLRQRWFHWRCQLPWRPSAFPLTHWDGKHCGVCHVEAPDLTCSWPQWASCKLCEASVLQKPLTEVVSHCAPVKPGFVVNLDSRAWDGKWLRTIQLISNAIAETSRQFSTIISNGRLIKRSQQMSNAVPGDSNN